MDLLKVVDGYSLVGGFVDENALAGDLWMKFAPVGGFIDEFAFVGGFANENALVGGFVDEC